MLDDYGTIVEEHLPCGDCDSSDALTKYEKNSYCFSCNTHRWLDDSTRKETKPMTMKVPVPLPDISETVSGPIKERHLSKETIQHYGVRLTRHEGEVTEHHYPYTDKEGQVIAYKKRIVETKGFSSSGKMKDAVLFGQSQFTSGGRYLTICEGEIDTMSVFQMQGSKFPTVGVKSSSDAFKICKQQFEWIDSYENIIVCMDSDEVGQKAAKLIAQLFPKKAKIVKMKLNDPNEYLMQGKEGEFTNAWWRAELYRPDDILGGAEAMLDIITQPRAEAMFQYPWDKVNDLTYGLRTGEFSIITAGSGMGKTQVLREICYHALTTTDKNVGVLYLEESAWETGRGIVSIDLSKPTHLPDTHVTEDELLEGVMNTWGTDRLYSLGDSWKDNNVDFIAGKIKFMAKGLDCKLIILDHISFMVSDQSGDERKMLDEIGHTLKALTIELDISLLAVCHSKRQSTKPLEEGGSTSLSDLRGTAGLGQLSNIVLGLERNGQADDEVERNTTLIRVLKNRFSGLTGPTSYLHYDRFTGRLTEVDKKEEEDVV